MSNKMAPHRLGALIDGIFAIVMTILVLDIKVPHDTAILRTVNMEQFLTGQFQDIIVYMTAFILLGYIWVVLHQRAHFIKYTSHFHVWLNMIFLMFVAIVPFSSALVSKFPGDTTAALFFSGNIFIIGLLEEWTWVYATKGRRLVDDTLTNAEISVEKKRSIILPAVAMIAMAVAFVAPLVSSHMLLIAPVAILFVKKR